MDVSCQKKVNVRSCRDDDDDDEAFRHPVYTRACGALYIELRDVL